MQVLGKCISSNNRTTSKCSFIKKSKRGKRILKTTKFNLAEASTIDRVYSISTINHSNSTANFPSAELKTPGLNMCIKPELNNSVNVLPASASHILSQNYTTLSLKIKLLQKRSRDAMFKTNMSAGLPDVRGYLHNRNRGTDINGLKAKLHNSIHTIALIPLNPNKKANKSQVQNLTNLQTIEQLKKVAQLYEIKGKQNNSLCKKEEFNSLKVKLKNILEGYKTRENVLKEENIQLKQYIVNLKQEIANAQST